MQDVTVAIKRVLTDQGNLSMPSDNLRDDDDLYQRGLSSFASVNVMIALEELFGVEIPDDLLRRETFSSVSSIRRALGVAGVPS